MSRTVTIKERRPYVITEGKFPLHICACGLSKNKPYCDGTHRTIPADEPE